VVEFAQPHDRESEFLTKPVVLAFADRHDAAGRRPSQDFVPLFRGLWHVRPAVGEHLLAHVERFRMLLDLIDADRVVLVILAGLVDRPMELRRVGRICPFQ